MKPVRRKKPSRSRGGAQNDAFSFLTNISLTAGPSGAPNPGRGRGRGRGRGVTRTSAMPVNEGRKGRQEEILAPISPRALVASPRKGGRKQSVPKAVLSKSPQKSEGYVRMDEGTGEGKGDSGGSGGSGGRASVLLRSASQAVPTSMGIPMSVKGKGPTFHSAAYLKRKKKTDIGSKEKTGLSTSPLPQLLAEIRDHAKVGSISPEMKSMPTPEMLPRVGSGELRPLDISAPISNYVYYTASSNRVPVSICSLIPYKKKLINSQKKKQSSVITPDKKKSHKMEQKATLDRSFAPFLRPHDVPYDPLYLDDPQLTMGKHRVVMDLPYMRVTLLPYVSSSELKEELNERFLEMHPTCPITLSKLRSLKKNMLMAALSVTLDLAVVAVAYVCLEKLTLYKYITSDTRKCDAAVCMLLAYKFYHYSMSRSGIASLLDACEKSLGVSPREVLAREMFVYTRLQFDISARPEDIKPHYIQLQDAIRSTNDSILTAYRHHALKDYDVLSIEQHTAFAEDYVSVS